MEDFELKINWNILDNAFLNFNKGKNAALICRKICNVYGVKAYVKND